MARRGRPPHPDILTPREWEVLALLRQGLSNPEIGERLDITRRGARWHVSEIISKLGVTDRRAAAAWRPSRRVWWKVAALAFLAWPFKSLWWGSAAKAATAAAVAATVVTFAIPGGFDIFVTLPTSSGRDFYVVTADEMARLTDEPGRDIAGAWSPDCSRIVFVSDRDNPGDRLDIYIMDPNDTSVVNLTRSPRNDTRPVWSPDGTRIAFHSVLHERSDVYVMNADGTGRTNLTNAPARNAYPHWSPGGERILITSTRDGNMEVYVMNADGSGQTNLTHHPSMDRWARWSPDGTRIAFASDRDVDPSTVKAQLDIYVMNADGSRVTRLTDSLDSEFAPHWSPDGEWISFTRIPDGARRNVYIMRPDGSEVSHLVEGRGGSWSSCQWQGQ